MAYQPFQTFQVLAPIPMPITASSYTEAVKNYVKLHRSQSIDQLIIADQLNNNRMLANIKYYNANNRNKFSANLVPTTLTTLNGGMYPYGPMMGPMMPMGSGPTGRPIVGPLMGGPMVGGPMMLARASVPYGAPASTGSVLAPGSIITATTVLGTSVELPSGTVLPVGSVIEPTDNFPQGFCLPFGTYINTGIIWTPLGTPWTASAHWDINGNVTVAIIPSNINGIFFPVGTYIPAGACFPPGTFISPNTILINTIVGRPVITQTTQTNTDVCLPKGTVIPRGTVFNNTSFLPLGTVIAKGTNIPLNTNLPNVSLPSGTFIDLTRSPTAVNFIQANIIPPLTPFIRFSLTGAFNIPANSNFPAGFVFPPPNQSSRVFVPAPAMAIAPMSSYFGRPLSPRLHHRRHHRSPSPRRR
jgi:hypothetical protein